MHRAHCVAYELFVGPIPDGLIVRHTCDLPRCCQPLHLQIGTPADNSRDKVERGRQSRGDNHPRSIFAPEQVLSIRAQHAEGFNSRVIADQYGCSYGAIHSIVTRRTWKHI